MIYSVLNYIPFLIKLPYPTCFEKTMRPNLSILQLRWYCHPYPEKSYCIHCLFFVYKLSMIPSESPIVGTMIPFACTLVATSIKISAAGTITSARSGFNLNSLMRCSLGKSFKVRYISCKEASGRNNCFLSFYLPNGIIC